MDELARELASLHGAVVPEWNEARADRLLAGIGQLRQRRRAQRVAGVSALTLALCCVGYLQLRPSHGVVGAARLNASAPGLAEPGIAVRLLGLEPNRLERDGQPLQLADGSKVHALSRVASITAERNEAGRIGLRLDKGAARFDVIPNPKREFVVHAGALEVSVLGTIFDVDRDGDRVRVSVTRGKVRVSSTQQKGEPTFLLPGDSSWFDEAGHPIAAAEPADAADLHDLTDAAVSPDERPSSTKARATRGNRHAAAASRQNREAPRAAWRSLSQSGDYEGAYQLLQQDNAVEDDSGALLDAADAARLSGHPQAAVQYLRKVLDQHRETPVAPLAAFTLGRVLLERLGQPSEAADAFATARQLAPGGSLAQDALAREVEAWSKAGHPDEAYRCAREYIDAYPQGRRLRSVQLYGGIQ